MRYSAKPKVRVVVGYHDNSISFVGRVNCTVFGTEASYSGSFSSLFLFWSDTFLWGRENVTEACNDRMLFKVSTLLYSIVLKGVN